MDGCFANRHERLLIEVKRPLEPITSIVIREAIRARCA
jgi:hypothetical protein